VNLRADFSTPVSSVSIDLVPDDSDDPGFLKAYNSAGVLLQDLETAAPPYPGYLTMTITRPTADIAYIVAGGQSGQSLMLDHLVVVGGAATSDYYSVQVSVPASVSAMTLGLWTTTPGDGPGEPVNTLDPKIELYDAGQHLLASNDNGAADGRNARLAYRFTASGTYLVRVTSVNNSSGAYVFQAAALPGDANLDGTVDNTDLSRVLTNFDKSSMTWNQGDFDGNGTVDNADLSKLLANFDNKLSAAASPATSPAAGDCPDFCAPTRSGGTKMGLSPSPRTAASKPLAPPPLQTVDPASLLPLLRAAHDRVLQSTPFDDFLASPDWLDELAGTGSGNHNSKKRDLLT
jgi:hypothetical protein